MKLIDLYEVFNSTSNIAWDLDDNKHRGSFSLDDLEYTIHIDEWVLGFPSGKKTLLDLGFSYDTENESSQKMTNFNKNTSKILGIVSAGIAEKLRNIKYDILLFGASHKNGNVDTRMKIYYYISKRYMAEGMIKYDISNFTKKFGKYILLSNNKINKNDMVLIKNHIDN
jgi:hypothetical protein